MSTAVIQVEGLSKKYTIRHRNEDDGLRHLVESAIRSPWRWLMAAKRSRGSEKEEFWAVKNVSFDIERGSVVGVIGRNGAGKSTLLKILSRITEPSSGSARIRGRVASLLEVGTGFHQELTGRENIFLNGAILGMSRMEIRRKLDEIVAFSEIERFLDTPVKRYSSGMYVRLAFAVAAHLEPEILIVDEVLAVGDAQFQQKCLGKMDEVSKAEGRTILFVSHNMGAVRQLCTQVLLLEKGSIAFLGDTREGVSKYLVNPTNNKIGWKRQVPIPSEPGVYFREVSILEGCGRPTDHFHPRETVRIVIDVEATAAFSRAQISARFTNVDGIAAFCTCSTDYAGKFEPFEVGKHRLVLEIPAGFFMPGRYSLHLGSHVPRDRGFEAVDNEISIEIAATGSTATAFGDNRPGVVVPVFPWKRTQC